METYEAPYKKMSHAEIMEALYKPLPKEAIKPQTHKPQFSSINAVFIAERLMWLFGGDWGFTHEVVDKAAEPSKGKGFMVVVKGRLVLPIGLIVEQYGGNDNIDLGDAYKGATTDAFTKCASWAGIGSHVFKGDPYPREYANRHEEVAQQVGGAMRTDAEKAAAAKAYAKASVDKYTALANEGAPGAADMVENIKEAWGKPKGYEETIQAGIRVANLLKP